MLKHIVLLMIVLCWLPLTAASETAEPVQKHHIDVLIEKLEAEDSSTHGLIRAYTTGLELWDKELNRVYQELVKALGTDKVAIKALKESQREWIKFRDLEIHWVSLLYGKKDGSMFRPMSAYSIMDITRQRALKLADRLRILNEM